MLRFTSPLRRFASSKRLEIEAMKAKGEIYLLQIDLTSCD